MHFLAAMKFRSRGDRGTFALRSIRFRYLFSAVSPHDTASDDHLALPGMRQALLACTSQLRSLTLSRKVDLQTRSAGREFWAAAPPNGDSLTPDDAGGRSSECAF